MTRRACRNDGAIAWLLLAACAREPEGRFAQEHDPAPADAATKAGLHFTPTIEAARRDGETIVPVLELATSAARRVDAVVVVHRAAQPLAIELWAFEQPSATDVLQRVGEPEALLRMTGGATSAQALAPLRLRLAAPGATVQRRVGIEADTPELAMQRLADAATTTRDESATPAVRVDALATVFAGLDDGVLFERDALGLAIDRLVSGSWIPTGSTSASDRRARVQTQGGDTLELLRKGDGWVVATIDPR